MRDGFKLEGEVYRFADSDSGAGGQQYPVTVLYTIYDLEYQRSKYVGYWMEDGHIYVGVHMRDSYSGGTPFQFGSYDSAYQVTEDAYDLAEWISRQPWCDGNVGFKGGSGNGVGGSAAIWANHPAIKVVDIVHSSSNFHDYWLYENGVRRDTFGLVSHRQVNVYDRLNSVPDTVFNDKQEWLDWAAKRAREGTTAYFESAGLYDIFQEAALDNYEILAPYGRAHVRLEPRWHGPAVGWDGQLYSIYTGRNAYAASYDDYISGGSPADSSMIDYTVIEPDGVSSYTPSEVWPLEHTRVPHYLNDDLTLSLTPPATTGNSLTYQYDPNDPMPPVGGKGYIDGVSNAGPLDQSVLASRTDQLRFVGPVLTEQTKIIGPIEADLYIETDVEDTLFVVKLVAIDPSTGYEALIRSGVYMARYYDGPGVGQRLQSGQVYRLQFKTWTASAAIPAGYRLAFHVTSSMADPADPADDAYYEVHPNSFDPVADLTNAPVANNTIHMSSQYPSSVIVPIVGFNPDAPQIRVAGAGTDITNGDDTPDTADDTAFGVAATSTGSTIHTFTIHNDSSVHALNLTGSPRVTISGAHAADFTVTAQPSTPVAASGNQTFNVEFAPSAAGLRTATVSIASDDPWRSPYTFAVSGWGAPAGTPEIEVAAEGSDWLADGDATPSWDEWTDFEEVRKYRHKTRTFTIYNQGLSNLNLADAGGGQYVTVSGASAFTITSQPSAVITPGSSATFAVRYAPTAAGSHSATILIQSNDADEATFDFAVSGTANNYLPVVNGDQGTVSVPVDQTTNTPLDHEVFYDPDGDAFIYSVRQQGGGTAPAWVSINPNTGEITTTPTSGDVGSYNLEVMATEAGEGGTVLTDAFTLEAFFAPPTISAQPVDTAVASGNSASFSVTAAGTPPLSYQWYEGISGDTASPVSGGTDASLVTGPITAPTTFWVRVTDGNTSTVDSNAATVSLIAPPAVTAPPQSTTSLSGSTATFEVAASGGGLSYQWYLGTSGDTSKPIAGATSASYTTPGLSTDTTVWVRVTNEAGTDDSNAATATVSLTAPSLLFNFGSTEAGNWNNYPDNSMLTGTITTGLSGLIYDDGASASGVTLDIEASTGTINVSSHGPNTATYAVDWLTTGASTYMWRLNGNNSSYRFTVNGLAPGTYTLEAYCYQDVGSSWAFDRMTLNGGISGSTEVTTTSYDTTEFNANLTGGQVASWSNLNLGAGESIELEVTGGPTENAIINAFRIKASAEPPTGPTLFASPQAATISAGNTATLQVVANGNGTLSYQWYEGTSGDTATPLVGANQPSYTTPSLSADTSYWVRVTDDNGSVDSASALITVSQGDFSSWTDTYTLTGNDRQPDADPDGDNVPNILEYLVGSNPTSRTHLAPRGGLKQSGGLSLQLVGTNAQLPTDIQVVVYGSQNLVQWSNVSASVQITPNGDGTYTYEFTEDTPTTAYDEWFLRLEVSDVP